MLSFSTSIMGFIFIFEEFIWAHVSRGECVMMEEAWQPTAEAVAGAESRALSSSQANSEEAEGPAVCCTPENGKRAFRSQIRT